MSCFFNFVIKYAILGICEIFCLLWLKVTVVYEARDRPAMSHFLDLTRGEIKHVQYP